MKKFICISALTLILFALLVTPVFVYAEDNGTPVDIGRYDFGTECEISVTGENAGQIIKAFLNEKFISYHESYAEENGYTVGWDEYFIGYCAGDNFTENLMSMDGDRSVLSKNLRKDILIYIPIYADVSDGRRVAVGDIEIRYDEIKGEYLIHPNYPAWNMDEQYISGKHHFVEKYRALKGGEYNTVILVGYDGFHSKSKIFICVSDEKTDIFDINNTAAVFGEDTRMLFSLEEYTSLRLEYERKRYGGSYIDYGGLRIQDIFGISRIYHAVITAAIVLCVLLLILIAAIIVLAIRIRHLKKRIRALDFTKEK